MKRFKKGCMLLAATVVLFSLAACDDKTKIQILGDTNLQPEYLSFFSSTSMYGSDVTKYWADLFTETYHKQVYVNFEGASYYADEGLSYRELLEKRLKSSSPDDLYIINAEDVLEFGKKGYWMDLSDMEFVNNLSDAALYQSTYNGKIFSVPLSFTGFGFLWNVDLLKEHGLSVPQNLDEFLQTCDRLKSDGILPYGANKGFALTVPAMCAGLSELYGSADQDQRLAALNSGETPISDYLCQGYELLSTMIEKGYLDPQQALNTTPYEEDFELFLEGKCAFICTGLGNLSSLEERPFLMKMTGIPLSEDGYVTVYGAVKRLCVNPESKHLDTALQFIEMVGSHEALERSAELDNTMSSSKWSSNNGLSMERELVSLIQQPNQIPNQDFALHFNMWESIRDVARELCGGISVDQACAMLDEKQQTDLKAYMESN